MRRLSVFLVMAALVAATVGCHGSVQYVLSITSTQGGSVTEPGEGPFTCDQGTVISLVAETEEGYSFAGWTGDVGTIADVSEAATNITMNGDYSITANFAMPILDWYDLDAIRAGPGGSYVLMNDLDSSTAGYTELASSSANDGNGWQSIGTGDTYASFDGEFDGQGHEIRDLFIDRPDEDYVGVFGLVNDGGLIKDIGVVNISAAGNAYVGGLVGMNMHGTVTDSYSTGSVTGDYFIGGLVGGSNGTVINSYSAASVVGDWMVGGLMGVNIYGGTVANSCAAGDVAGTKEVGGLVGYNVGTSVANSYWDIETSGQSSSAGGTGANTAEMKDITTFSGSAWDIAAVAPGEADPAYIWNIVDGQSYPFLSWQAVA
jgi:uncharacterized repeat protein (TIGR02543 family)